MTSLRLQMRLHRRRRLSVESYLLIISDREALSWVLTTGRMAFPAGRATAVSSLRAGDELFLYTTRSCFHNPARDRGRVVGRGIATSSVKHLDRPVEIAGRRFSHGCTVEF